MSGEGRRPLLHRVGHAGAAVGRRPPQGRAGRLALQLGIPVLIFGFLVFTVASQWGELRDESLRFEPGWLALSALVLGAFYAFAANGWDLIIRFLGHRLDPVKAQTAWGKSILARYVPGSLLMIVGRMVLAEREGVPRRTVLASFVYELGLGVGTGAIVGAYFLINHPDLQGEVYRWAVLLVLPVVVLGLHPRVFRPLADAGLHRLGRDPLPAVMPFRGVLAMVVYYLLYWGLAGVGLYCVARAVYPLGVEELPAVMAAQALAYCAAVATLVVPGGLGVRDGAFAWALQVSLPSGSSFGLAAAIAIAVRLMLTLVEVGYVMFVSALSRRSATPVARESEGGA